MVCLRGSFDVSENEGKRSGNLRKLLEYPLTCTQALKGRHFHIFTVFMVMYFFDEEFGVDFFHCTRGFTISTTQKFVFTHE
jgi:hypothetical protein